MTATPNRETVFITFSRHIEGKGEHGGDIIRERGCNGMKHVDYAYELALGGETDSSRTLVGECDGSCGAGLLEAQSHQECLWFFAEG